MHNREPSSNPSFPRFQERLWPAGKKEKAREQREIEEEEESGKVVTAESPSPSFRPCCNSDRRHNSCFLPFQHYELSGILRPQTNLVPPSPPPSQPQNSCLLPNNRTRKRSNTFLATAPYSHSGSDVPDGFLRGFLPFRAPLPCQMSLYKVRSCAERIPTKHFCFKYR